jgi:hypothetical protein
VTIDIPIALLGRTQAAKPLHMWVFLLRKTGEHSSRPLVRTPPVIFNMK